MYQTTNNSHGKSDNRFQYPGRGYASKLPPSIQIANTVATMTTMRGGNDLRNWSLSARKELLQGGEAILLVKKETEARTVPAMNNTNSKNRDDNFHYFAAPKLILIVASSLFRANFEKFPDKKEVKIVHPKVTPNAIKAITAWLSNLSTTQIAFNIPMPANLPNALEIRAAAQILGMDQYVEHMSKRYCTGVHGRIPTIPEAKVVLDHMIDEQDTLLVALAGRLGYLLRSDNLTAEQRALWDAFLQTAEAEKLAGAIKMVDERAA